VILSGGIDVVSDYRFRGLSRSDGKVAVQPSLIVDHDSGLYAGLLGSTLPDSPRFGRFELGLTGGYSAEIASGTRAGASLTWYSYPGGRDGAGPADYVDIAGSLSHDIGPLSARARVAYAPKQKALGDGDNLYLNLGLTAGVPNTPVTLSASVGRTDGALGALAADGDYFDWSIGAAYASGIVMLKAEYVDTDIRKTGVKALDRLSNPTVVFTLGVAF
jgi:uncharacterized protein (TIGR02001 family)